MTLDLVVYNIRPWLGQHYSDGTPWFLAEDVEGSSKLVCPSLYSYSRFECGRRCYVLKAEVGDEYE